MKKPKNPKKPKLRFTICSLCYRIQFDAKDGDQCLRGYKNPVGHEVPRCKGIMRNNTEE